MPRQVHIHIDVDCCRTCRRCLAAKACRVRAIVKLDPDEPPYIDIDRCYDCRLCIPACPFLAITAYSSPFIAQVS